MKKIAFVLILCSFWILGCEKKEPELPQISGRLDIWASSDVDFWEALGREFVSIFDSSSLSVRVIAFESEEELTQMLPGAIFQKKGPDILVTSGDWIAHNREKLIPLTNDESLQPEKFDEYFVPAVKEALVENQSIWGVPLGVETLAVIYNGGHFTEEFGEATEVGDTWEKFREQVEALNRKDNSFQRFSRSGGAIGRVDNINRGAETFFELFLQLTGNLFSEDGMEASFAENKGVLSTGERVNFALQALKFYLGFSNPGVSYHSWNELLVSPESQYKDFEAFVKGEVSLVFGTPRDFRAIQTLFSTLSNQKLIPQNNVRIGFLPQFQSPDETSVRNVLGSIEALSVPVSSRDSQLAWQFLKFAMRSENLQGFFKSTGIPSPRADMLLQQEAMPFMEVFARQAKVATGKVFPIAYKDILFASKQLVLRVQSHILTNEEGLREMEQKFTHRLTRKRVLEEALTLPTQ